MYHYHSRKSAPRERAQSHRNDYRDYAADRMQQIGGDHHEHRLRQERATVEVTAHLRRGQPTLDLAHVRKVAGNGQ